jgi:hypothetical protein
MAHLHRQYSTAGTPAQQTTDNLQVVTFSGREEVLRRGRLDVRDGFVTTTSGISPEGTVDGSPDVVKCGRGEDTVFADPDDKLKNCEVTNPGTVSAPTAPSKGKSSR